MIDEKQSEEQSLVDLIWTLLAKLPWPKLLNWVKKAIRQMMPGHSGPGMYEVLEYESTLELHDRSGKRATFRKREKVRYLQSHIIAYQDQAWGDGEILLNYRCTPGKPSGRILGAAITNGPLDKQLCVVGG